jgi:hypothetical protein
LQQGFFVTKYTKKMARTTTLLLGGGIFLAAAAAGTYLYGLSNAAKGLSINTFARIHDLDLLGETTLSIDIAFVNGSQNNIAFTYPYVRVFRAGTTKQLAFSVPKDEKITIAKSSTTTVKDIRIKMNTIDLAMLAGELLKGIAAGEAAVIPLQIQIDSQLAGLLAVNFTLTDKADISITKYWNFLKGLFGKNTKGIHGVATHQAYNQADNQAPQAMAHLLAAHDTLIGVVANDNQTVVHFTVPQATYLGRFPKIYDKHFSTFQTPYGDRAIGATNDMLLIYAAE